MRLDLTPLATPASPLATPASPLTTPAPWLAGLRAAPLDYPTRPHRGAAAAALKHAEHLDSYLRSSPVPPHTAAAFADFEGWLATQNSGAPLILDSGCGTALSTRTLAARHPDALVVGVDRSEHRLSRRDGPHADALTVPPNALLVRAELAAFWRLLLERGLSERVAQHHLLYPNPYPKPSQRSRRWHFHPSLPLLLQIGGTLELRTNWLAYAAEFRAAVRGLARAPDGGAVPDAVRAAAARRLPATLTTLQIEPEEGLSRFEQKYATRGPLYALEFGE